MFGSFLFRFEVALKIWKKKNFKESLQLLKASDLNFLLFIISCIDLKNELGKSAPPVHLGSGLRVLKAENRFLRVIYLPVCSPVLFLPGPLNELDLT